LPELIQSLEFGGAGAKALKPILTIGSRLGTKEFEILVTPAIIKLFNSSDRSIRLALCEKIDTYINQLSDQVCNDFIYPNLVCPITFIFSCFS
jgi:SCY1-like protein 1